MSENLPSFWERLLIGKHQFESTEVILRYKMMMLSVLILIFIITIGSIGAFRNQIHEEFQAMLDFGFCAFMALGWLILRIHKRVFMWLARFLFLLGLGLAVQQMFWYPHLQSRMVWFSSAVYIGFFLLDRREGWIWIATIITILTALQVYEPNLILMSNFEFVTFIVNLFIIALLLGWYETFKEQNITLEHRHHLELEEKIVQKTRELQWLNDTLHQRVNKEIEKNREKEKQIIHQSRLAQLGEMISMIAHQWRQPLASISATAAGLQLKIIKDQYDQQYYLDGVNNISRYTKHLSSTIDDFRNFFMHDKEMVSFSLKASVERSLEIISSTLEHHNILVQQEYKNNPEVMGYPNEIRQVILNLLKNAQDILIEHNVKNPWIKIRIETIGQNALLSISDNAGGIDPKIKEHLFEPYFTTKAKHDGMGLGLYMSKMIVEKHSGGHISAYNTESGATFEVSLMMT